jgi:hypothetical protein
VLLVFLGEPNGELKGDHHLRSTRLRNGGGRGCAPCGSIGSRTSRCVVTRFPVNRRRVERIITSTSGEPRADRRSQTKEILRLTI